MTAARRSWPQPPASLGTRSGRQLAMALALASLVACGGGGGGSSPAPPPTVTPPPPPPPPPAPERWAVAGALTVLSEAILDRDTNNPDNRALDNDTLETAQPTPNPATIGGYVAAPGSGESGAVASSGDIDDYYRIEAVAGQRITLLIADADDADIDLYLYNADGFIEVFSAGTENQEEVVVPSDGAWFINPSAFTGASNYTLTLGGQGAVNPAVRPGELIVTLAGEQVLRPDAARQQATTLARELAAEWRGGDRGRERLLSVKGTPPDRFPMPAHARQKAAALAKDSALQAQWQTWQWVKQLQARGDVARVEPNYLRKSLLTSNDPFLDLQWDHGLINLPAAWDYTVGDPSIVVAVIDSGVVLDHPDLRGQLLPGFDFVADPVAARDGDGLDNDPTDEGPAASADIGAYSYHGTHVTGIVGAAGNNGIGIAGVAYGARVMPLRAVSGDTGSSYDVLQAVRYAAGLSNDSGEVPTAPARIINLSLGGDVASQAERDLMNSIVAGGTVVVAAAGNEGAGRLSYPAAYDAVIAVGATDLEGNLTSYSNTGSGLDLVAPGGDGGKDRNGDGYPDAILSTGVADGDPAYTFLAGTSMATPVVSGVIALMQSVNPDLDAGAITALLEQGALTIDRGDPGYDREFGWGLIDAQKAVLAALDSLGDRPSRPAQLTASTTFANLGASLNSLELTLNNRGTESLEVTGVSSDVSWLSVDPLAVDAVGLGSWQIRADRSELAEGQYRGQVRFTSSVNTVEIEVSLRVAANALGDVGVLYVLFYDPATEEVALQVTANRDGSYRFSGEVTAGAYEVWAGTDHDNDQFICDAGESCGSFRTLDAPITVVFDQPRRDLDFPSGYQLTLRAVDTTQRTVQQARALRRLE